MDGTDVLMVIVDRDRMGRVTDVEVYEPGAPPPDWAEDYLPHAVRHRERQVKDPRDEVKWIAHQNGSWYTFEGGPLDGEQVQGKDNVPDQYTIE